MTELRAAFDFETWEWTHALSCAIVYGLPGERHEIWICDRTALKDKRPVDSDATVIAAKSPEEVVKQTIYQMFRLSKQLGISQFWAHNLGRFDGLFISAGALSMGCELTGRVVGSRVISLDFEAPTGKRRIQLFDSLNLAPSQLGHKSLPCTGCIACDFELPSRKLFGADDYSIDAREWEAQKLLDGNLADCHLVLELLERLETMTEDLGGKLGKTFAGTALSVIKARLRDEGTKFPDLRKVSIKTSKKSEKFENLNSIAGQSFYGGRVEVFEHHPNVWLQEYDVTSSYPWSMSQPLPWQFIGVMTNAHEIRRYMDAGESLICKASVHVPEMHIPPLPYKVRGTNHDGIFFPTGEWTAWFTSVELLHAERYGVRIKPLCALLYTTESPFESFIRDVFATKSTAKREGKKALETFSKYLLNSSYGKLGESPEHETLRAFNDKWEAYDYAQENPQKKVRPVWAKDGRFVAESYFRWGSHSHYAAASYITSRSRILLHDGLAKAERASYCDTDSIHCESAKFTGGSNLGDFKLELGGARYRGEFFAPKIYRLTEEKPCERKACKVHNFEDHEEGRHIHLASKGFPVGADEFEIMLNSAVDPEGPGVTVSRMRLLRSQLKADDWDVVQRIQQQKRWGGFSVKRFPFPDGSTRAWTVEELKAGAHENVRSPLILSNSSE